MAHPYIVDGLDGVECGGDSLLLLSITNGYKQKVFFYLNFVYIFSCWPEYLNAKREVETIIFS